MDNKFCTEAYIYGLETMLEEARQTIIILSFIKLTPKY